MTAGDWPAFLLTSANWDHISGVADFPGVPLLVTAEERRFIDQGPAIMAIARSVSDACYDVYDFEGGPCLGFIAVTTCTAGDRGRACSGPDWIGDRVCRAA